MGIRKFCKQIGQSSSNSFAEFCPFPIVLDESATVELLPGVFLRLAMLQADSKSLKFSLAWMQILRINDIHFPKLKQKITSAFQKNCKSSFNRKVSQIYSRVQEFLFWLSDNFRSRESFAAAFSATKSTYMKFRLFSGFPQP